MYYIAFMKDGVEGCLPGGCTNELRVQLIYLFVIFLSFNGVEIGIPLMKRKFSKVTIESLEG